METKVDDAVRILRESTSLQSDPIFDVFSKIARDRRNELKKKLRNSPSSEGNPFIIRNGSLQTWETLLQLLNKGQVTILGMSRFS